MSSPADGPYGIDTITHHIPEIAIYAPILEMNILDNEMELSISSLETQLVSLHESSVLIDHLNPKCRDTSLNKYSEQCHMPLIPIDSQLTTQPFPIIPHTTQSLTSPSLSTALSFAPPTMVNPT